MADDSQFLTMEDDLSHACGLGFEKTERSFEMGLEDRLRNCGSVGCEFVDQRRLLYGCRSVGHKKNVDMIVQDPQPRYSQKRVFIEKGQCSKRWVITHGPTDHSHCLLSLSDMSQVQGRVERTRLKIIRCSLGYSSPRDGNISKASVTDNLRSQIN